MYSNDFFLKVSLCGKEMLRTLSQEGQVKEKIGCGGPEVGRRLLKGEEGQASIRRHGLQDKVQFCDNCFYMQKSEGRAVV